ncbi:MAG: hypothetical protein A2268_13920 [Candidatus Raymondbacteria bacterium RifOxyA12_full_50_37]|uniref:FecR protein domain-containing protein n=1 Tax=Candidatus Raymondbacteria bacterium RIFOXYD12_FULL_49_13 TaxID=1817890 RepID=A0A1F7FL93_UNCRA|nr:MAG: hypothetical protein A2268_13920 [Candidatus Raymondbacteria bacterium RifOxyA12_full_50_37]OGJ88176.1 MAG: hypothetical protein A2248_19260 [Candidatus Raymondbacteria bacterium RIFOXYA2_FULL_49_16]OGJ98131.1 MAG: hypothetical protein A2350_00200 [Candidatus Raymondbacteria bacterium RifOxyB12_full_50_8]OGJ98412.1 MAG: hypothetical protein A2487_02720 [Candidatus Raymondbacteria bacterium RifOxyC12_full_50_8]OGK07222.1 MAG: hypothetical protein A2519_13925 [Candidatus Raymondbacteria b
MHVHEKIDLLVNGSLGAHDREELTRHVASCASCRDYLNAHLATDALISAVSPTGILNDKEWDDLIQEAVKHKEQGPLFSDAEWHELIETAWEKHATAQKTQSLFKPLFALAACLVVFAGGYLLYSRHMRPSQQSVQIPVTAPAPAPSSAREEILPITDNAVAVLSDNADLVLKKVSSDTVCVNLRHGSAFFSVKKNSFAKFEITTPDARVRVTGTSFQVQVHEKTTEVAVLSGTVIVQFTASGKTLFPGPLQQVLSEKTGPVLSPLPKSIKTRLAKYLDRMPRRQPNASGPRTSVPACSLANDAAQQSNTALSGAAELLSQAYAFSSAGEYEKALDCFEHIKALPEKSRVVQTAWIEAAFIKIRKTGDREAGGHDLQTYISRFSNGTYIEESLVELADLARKEAKIEGLLSILNDYLVRFPKGSYRNDYLYETATLLRQDRKEYARAIPHYTQYIHECPQCSEAENALFWLGVSCREANDPAGARSAFSRYKEQYPRGRWIQELNALEK